MALRDVVSYLITAQDQTRAATESAKRNLAGLQSTYAGVQRTMRAISSAGIGFISVSGLKAGVAAVIETRVELERMRNTLSQGVGAQNVAGEVLFLRKAADELGQSFVSLSGSYAKFSAASRGTALEGQGTRDVFLAVSKASTVLGMSADQTSGALNAIQQMISKGTVQSEELRGQLGERLPGAFQIAARAMGVTTVELSKMLEQGEVVSEEFLPRFAQQLETEFAGSLDAATKSAAASVNRLSSSWDELKQITAEGVIGQGAIAGVDTLSRYLNALNDDLNAVRLGMLSFIGTSRSALSIGDIDSLSRGLRTDPGSLGEARLRREDGMDPTGSIAAAASQKAEAAQLARNGVAWDALTKKYRTAAEKRAEIAQEIRKTGQAAGKSQSEIQRLIAASAGTGQAKLQLRVDKADLGSDLAEVRRALAGFAADYQNTEAILEATKQAGTISDREYFGEKIRLMTLAAEVQAQALERENDRRRQEKLSGVEQIRSAQEIADNEAEIARIRAKAAAQGTVFSTQQAAAIDRLKVGYEEAKASAEAYLAAAERGYARDLSGIGAGDSERQRRSGQSQVEDRYSQMRLQAASEFRTGAVDKAGYDQHLALIEEFQAKALAGWDRYYAELKAKQRDGGLGAQEAIANYIDEARNSFEQVKGAATNVFTGIQEGIVNTVRNGKLSFSSLADSIIADVSRIAAQKFIGMLLSSMFGTGNSFGTGAKYGNQDYGAYLATGTNRVPHDNFPAILHKDEAVVPARYNPAVGGGGGGQITIVQHNNFYGGQSDMDPDRIARLVGDVAVARVAEARTRGA